jgi:serine/threonine protein kinase
MKFPKVIKINLVLEAKNLLKGMLERDPSKRLTVRKILKHPWLSDVDPESKIFFINNSQLLFSMNRRWN